MNNKSFTLIEILVVIVVIGIISSFILVGMSSITNSANITKSKAFSNSLRNSLLNNLVSEWKLDGNTNDSWSNLNGTWSGPAGANTSVNYRPLSECVSGQCLDFDGYDDGVSFGSDSRLIVSNNWTFEHWIQWSGQSNPCVFYAGSGSSSRNFLIRNCSSQNMFAFRPTGGVEIYYSFVSSAEYINKWTHITWLGDTSNNVSLYINGKFALTRNIIAPHINAIFIGNIGRSYGGILYSYLGKMDEVRFYNAIMPISHIQQSYFLGLNSLYKNRGLTQLEYAQRLAELKDNLAQNNN